MNIAPMLGPTTEQAEQGVETITEAAEAVDLLAAVPEGVSFVNMNKSAHDLASRLHTATEDLMIMRDFGCDFRLTSPRAAPCSSASPA